jgi:hypothetical protein
MKKANANINKQVTLFVAVGALAWAAAVLAGPAGGGEPLSLGPGKVSFAVTPTGRWLGLVPDWAGGESVLAGGGVVVMCEGADGTVEVLANTSSGERLRASEDTHGLKRVYEGIPGGRRYPLAQRDDDGDGRTDEDRLDGVDNDGDGRTDEDFAAAGDQMVVFSFDAEDAAGDPLLKIHQQNYAWTLPHIDHMVAIKLSVRNVSGGTLHSVRVGAVVHKEGLVEATVSTRDFDSAPARADNESLASKAIVLTEAGRGGVAVLLFAQPATERSAWLTGLSAGASPLAQRVQMYVDAERALDPITGTTEPVPDTTLEQLPKPEPQPPTAFAISPDLGALEPGDEVTVYAALLAVADVGAADGAIESAYRTVVGDGSQRMIPPLVSLKRRAVWGSYKVEYAEGTDAPVGATITLENARAQGVGPGDLSYLSGVDVRQLEAKELFNGDVQLTLGGELYGEIADTGKRIELHGRLVNGEFVDLILNPAASVSRDDPVVGVTETQYWNRPGKLKAELLSGSPNPFRESTTIFYEVPSSVSDEEGTVLSFVNPVGTSVKIYNVAGRLVSILVDTILSPGQYTADWRAMDESGNSVASGVYYVKLQIGKKHVTKRLIQLK